MTLAGTKERICAVLRDCAGQKKTITYADLCTRVPSAPPYRSKALYQLLGSISEETYRRDQIFLTALVIGAGTGIPGEGFFTKMAFPCLGVTSVPDWVSFWERERDRVFQFYAH